MILMKDIIVEGNETLRKKAIDISLPLPDEDLKHLKDMMEYLDISQNDKLCEKYGIRPGVGIAAPQIGVSKRYFCINTYNEDGTKLYRYGFINPKIISNSKEKIYLPNGEGCLSVPDKQGVVKRYARIKIEAYVLDFNTMSVTFRTMLIKGYPAIVFQHEYDHLNGILFIDKITTDTKDATPVVFGSDEE